MEVENSIEKYAARFIMSWFGITMIKKYISPNQWIMYAHSLGDNNTTQYLLLSKQPTII